MASWPFFMAFAAKDIPIENLGKWQGIPHLERQFFPPPGKNSPENSYSYTLYSRNEIPTAIANLKMEEEPAETSQARRILLQGLLDYGGVGQFGEKNGTFDLGLNYDNFLKHEYKDEIAVPVYTALSEQIKRETQDLGYSKIDGVLAPERSGLKHGQTVADILQVEKIPVTKDFAPGVGRVEVALDGYSKLVKNVMSLTHEKLGKLKEKGLSNLLLVDDILDSGLMSQAIALLLQRARGMKEQFDVNLIGIVTPFEKAYTGARELIQSILGPIPIVSLIQIEDMGLLDERQVRENGGKEAWIKIRGMEKALPCNLTDFRD